MTRCPKCGYNSGDDWSQCVGGCPMKQSPDFDPRVAAQFDMGKREFCPEPPQ